MYRSPFLGKARKTNDFKKVSSLYAAGYHTGEDWVCDDDKTLVSPAAGVVVRNEYDKDYGYFVVIRTDDGRTILMAHMKEKSIRAINSVVSAGARIGTMGNTGKSTGAHLHIEVENATTWKYNTKLLKPSSYIDFNNYKPDDKGALYQNGSTIEKTYRTAADAEKGENSIGYLEQYESAVTLAKYGDKYVVLYNAGATKKVGFVNYSGGNPNPPSDIRAYQNGSTAEPTYETAADAANKKNPIGQLDIGEACDCVGKADGKYIVVYNTETGKKVGFVNYSGGVTL